MLTAEEGRIDRVDAPHAVMWTVSEVAARDGISRQAVSKKVKALVERHGLTVKLNGHGHVVRFNVAEYDHLRARFGDASKDQRPAQSGGAPPFADKVVNRNGEDLKSPDAGRGQRAGRQDADLLGRVSDSIDEAQRQKAWHEAERRRIELAELKGEMLRVADVVDAVVRCHEEIVRLIDRLPASTDEMAAAVARDGTHGLRIELKKAAAQIREGMAQALEALAAGVGPAR